jgi:hypothetical protein
MRLAHRRIRGRCAMLSGQLILSAVKLLEGLAEGGDRVVYLVSSTVSRVIRSRRAVSRAPSPM